MSGQEQTSVPQSTGPSDDGDDSSTASYVITSREHYPPYDIPKFSITLVDGNRLLPLHMTARFARKSILGIPMGAHTWMVVPKQTRLGYYYEFQRRCSWDPTISEAAIYWAFLRLDEVQYGDMMYKWKTKWTQNSKTQATVIDEDTWRSLADKWCHLND